MDNFIRGSLYETVQHLASGPGVRRPVELSSAKAFVAHHLNDHRLDKLRKLLEDFKKENKEGMHNFICQKFILFLSLYSVSSQRTSRAGRLLERPYEKICYKSTTLKIKEKKYSFRKTLRPFESIYFRFWTNFSALPFIKLYVSLAKSSS